MHLINWRTAGSALITATMLCILPGSHAQEVSITTSQQDSKVQAVDSLPDLTNENCIYYLKNKGKMKVTADVVNRGVGISGKTETEFWIADDDAGTNLRFLKRYKVSKLKPGKSKLLKLNVKDRSTWEGRYLYIYIDVVAMVPESDETNNNWYWGPFENL